MPINPVGDSDSNWVSRITWSPSGVLSSPNITGVSPASGSSAGGTQVTVTGSALGSAPNGTTTDGVVYFGASQAASASCVNVNGNSTCTVTSPPGTGVVHIRVQVNGVISTCVSADQFTYTGSGGGSGGAPVVSAVSPPFGPAGGGTQVTIVGLNLVGGSVRFGNQPASQVSCGAECLATSPSGLGPVHVIVTVGGIDSTVAAGGSDQFTYNGASPPAVSTVNGGNGPTIVSASVAGYITVEGTHFDVGGDFSHTQVYFGGQAGIGTTCSNVGTTGSQRCATNVPLGAGTVMVAVVNTLGGSATSWPLTELQYTPTLTALSTTVGPATGGTGVAISGAGLGVAGGTTSISFGGVAASNVTCSASRCLATAPAGVGVVDTRVSVTNQIPGCVCMTPQSTVVPAGRFAYVPLITSVGPASGPTGGNTTVSLAGAGFSTASGATTVAFGNHFAASVSCTATSPSNGTGQLVDVQATVAGQPSLKGSADQFRYGCSSTTVSFSPASPQVSGTTVSITGAATCDATPVYRIWIQDPVSGWALARDYSTTASFAWSTTGKTAGNYWVEVDAKDQGSALDLESSATQIYTLNPAPCTNATLSFTPVAPQKIGGTVSVTGSATCGGTPLYRFWEQTPTTPWAIVQNYATSATFSWNTAGQATGNYWFEVDVKNQGASADYEAYKTQVDTLGSCINATLSESPPSPNASRGTVTLSGGASCDGTAVYRFWIQNPQTGWYLAQDYSTSSSFAWNTSGLAAGGWWLVVDVKLQGAAPDYETYKLDLYTLQ